MSSDDLLPLTIDIFYSNKDITSLRWVSNLKREMFQFSNYVTVRVHELSSEHAKKMNIITESVIINNRKVESQQVSKIIKNLAYNSICV